MKRRKGPVALLAIDYEPSIGGVQSYLSGVVKCASGQGHEVVTLTPTPGPRSDNKHVVRLRPRGADPASRLILNLVVALRAVGLRPTSVLCGHVLLLPAALVVGRITGAPVVCFTYAAELVAPRSRWLTRRLLPLCDQIVAISRYTADLARGVGVPAAKLRVLPPAIDPMPEAAKPTPRHIEATLARLGIESPYFLTLGRIDDGHKGQDVCIEALAAVLQSHPTLSYVVAGDGVFSSHLALLAKVYGVQRAVHFVGRVNEQDKHALLAGAKCLVLLSRQAARNRVEGFGIAVLEAAQYGVPAVVGRSGGLPDAVDGELTGWLTDPTDIDAVTEALRQSLEGHAADARGQAAEARLRREFTWGAREADVRSLLAIRQ